MSDWKLSSGTAYVVLNNAKKSDVLPTTAYVMIGERCRNNCRFCSQSRDSEAGDNRLSRITWPRFETEEAVQGIVDSCSKGDFKRVCLQIVDDENSWENALECVQRLGESCPAPVCVSSGIDSVDQARRLLAAGAERVCIAIDAATPNAYLQAKGGDWEKRWGLLKECAAALPGRITSHLIVGLGETEAEMVNRLAECITRGVKVGLFAFTPVRGTAWGRHAPPAIGSYRRIQIAHWLLDRGCDEEVIQCRDGRIVGYRVPGLRDLLADGRAFETSGCPDCNRPYYNERPGGVMYNYPRRLTEAEVRRCIKESELPL